MYNHNKAQQSKNRVHISWDILYTTSSCYMDDCMIFYMAVYWLTVVSIRKLPSCSICSRKTVVWSYTIQHRPGIYVLNRRPIDVASLETWNFVTRNIADGVNKFPSLFCLILIWCVCMIFSKISLVTSHGAFSTRFDCTAGNTLCRKINQSTTSIHSVPSVLVFRTAQVENTRLKSSAVFKRCLTRERMQQ